jgi:hypothetical protein
VASFSISTSWPDLIGFEASVRVETESATLPPWWQIFNPGSCRPNALSLNTVYSGPGACVDPWIYQTASGIEAYVESADGAPNRARVSMAGAITEGRPIIANQEYFAFNLVISPANTTTCPGCTTPATLILEWIRVDRGTPSVLESRMLTSPLQNQCITWNGAQNICATKALPSRSWGQIKGLYR